MVIKGATITNSQRQPPFLKKIGYPGAEVARFLGVTNSAVNKAASSKKIKEVGKYI